MVILTTRKKTGEISVVGGTTEINAIELHTANSNTDVHHVDRTHT